ncbi:MAG: UDP-N-acetylglucosamine 2-epimerase (non-hydrolyzing) [Oceanicoccus sp.]
MIKLLTVLGARPQFVKASSLSRQIAQCPDIDETLLHTGQHYDDNMSDIFFSELQLPRPDHHLHIGSGSHAQQTAGMLTGIEAILLEQPFDMVVVYGDTNSTIAGALAAAKLQIPVAHIEAGLRSFNMNMPEEINRLLTDQISNIHFCPSETSIDNLKDNGIQGPYVTNCGDIMLETLLHYRAVALTRQHFIDDFSLDEKPYLLVTFHRAENTDNREKLARICQNLCELANSSRLIIPLHPRTRRALEEIGLLDQLCSVCDVIEPVGFIEMIALINFSSMVITDSGGLQKEAFFLGKQCIVIRDQTEWVELIKLQAAMLWTERSESSLTMCVQQSRERKVFEGSPYGDGNCSSMITKTIRKYFADA